MQLKLPIICVCSLALAIVPAASAQLHAGDYILYTDSNKVILAGSTGGGTYTPTRVFGSEFGGQGVPNYTTDPGFNTVPNMFPANQIVGVTIVRAARKWANGNFCTIPPETISMSRTGGGGTIITPPADPTAGSEPNLSLGFTALGTGFIHTHPTYGLDAPFADGVYLLSLRAWVGSVTNTAPAPSDTFWLILNQNAAQNELDAASTWLLAHVANISGPGGPLCPCPADFDNSGDDTIDDIFVFLNAWFASDLRADFDGVNGVTIDDIFVFLNAWFAGCP